MFDRNCVPKMCDKNSAKIFRPWDKKSESDEPSAFSPIEPKRACSVSSDDTTSSAGSLTMLQNFVIEKTSAEDTEAFWKHNAITTCYPWPAYSPGFLDESVWFSNYESNIREAVSRLNQQDAVAKQIKKLRPKKFKCEFCMVAFSNNGQLKGHLRIHTGERPFKCDADGCGKAFTRNEELTRHKRIHTGLRPYLCSVCSKGFGRKDHLKKHCKTHDSRHVVPGYHQQLAMAAVAAYAGYHHPKVHPFELI